MEEYSDFFILVPSPWGVNDTARGWLAGPGLTIIMRL
jgi:hypothetical protein